MLNIIKIFSLFVSIIIGAGFASGKELYTFFASLQQDSSLVIALTSILFFLLIYSTLELIRLNNTRSYNQFLNIIFKDKLLINSFELCVVIFMFISFASMLAGFTSLTTLAFGISKTTARLLFALLNFVLLIKGHSYIVKLSIILVPLIFTLSLFFGYSYLDEPKEVLFSSQLNYNYKFIFNSFAYSSYNLITAIAIISTLPQLCKNKFQNFFASLLISITLGILSITILIPMFANFSLIATSDMPIYTILVNTNKEYVMHYLVIMILATLSTSVANSYGTSNYLVQSLQIHYLLAVLLTIISGILFSLVGFSNIVKFIYPIFGFFGIIKMYKIFVKFYTK